MYIKNKHRKHKRGQSTVEYILLVTAVIAVLIVFMSSSGGFRGQMNSTLNTFVLAINEESTGYGNFKDKMLTAPSNGTSPQISVPINN